MKTAKASTRALNGLGDHTYVPYLVKAKPLDRNSTSKVSIRSLLRSVGWSNTKRYHSWTSVTGRRSRVSPGAQPIPTILIISDGRKKSRIWKRLTKSIFKSIIWNCTFSVEIIDATLEIPPRCFPILPQDSIHPKWDNIHQEILSRINIFTWTGLECWRYRRSSRAEDNSPTIIVSVRKDAVRRRYFTDTQQIKGILAENGDADVSILFMENESILHDAPIVPLDVCKDVVRPGVSLGLDESEAGTGTVGGLIELKFSGDKSWRLFGLSCFHVVYRPVEDNKTKAVPGARKGPPTLFWLLNILNMAEELSHVGVGCPSTLTIALPSDCLNSINHLSKIF